MPALLCLHQIWNQCMDKLYERHKLGHKTDRVTDYAWRWIQNGRKQSAEYTVQNSRPFCGIVTTGTGSHHIVDLEAKTCTCHDFQDYEMPCDHAVALCIKQEREPEDFVSPIFTIAEYKATYQSFLQPIDLNVLAAADVKPPEFVVQAGRPKIRRERRKRFDLSKQRMRCSIFKHNRRTCDHSGPSASNVSATRIHPHLQHTPICNPPPFATHPHLQHTPICNPPPFATHPHLQHTPICNTLTS